MDRCATNDYLHCSNLPQSMGATQMPIHRQAATKPLLGRHEETLGELPMAMQFRIELGRRLKAARLHAGLTQAELGALLDVENTTVSNVENGIRALSPELLEMIPQVLPSIDKDEWGRFLLEYQNPWLYRLLFTARGKPNLSLTISEAPPRQRRRRPLKGLPPKAF